MNFADRLLCALQYYGPLCVGIDPHKGKIPDLFGGDTPEGIANWAEAVIDIASQHVAVLKPQIGLFERHGAEGMQALQTVCQSARDKGLIVLADAKRGDIGSTAAGYAEAYLEPGAPFEADAVTVNPYMGLDTLEPFLERAERHGKGVIVLVRTSNLGAEDFQLAQIDGIPLYLKVIEKLTPLIKRLEGASGWSSLMLVVGATGPEEARLVRAAAPRALFLVPGYGHQGAKARDALAGFVAGEAGLVGGVVNASRSITFPDAAQTATTLSDWRMAVTAAMTQAKHDLQEAARNG